MPLTERELPSCHLVVYNVSRRGGQTYERRNETRRTDASGAEITEWETTKTLNDAEEFAKATSLQSKAKYALGKLGAHSDVGLLVRDERVPDVRTVYEEWQKQIDEFNADARFTRINYTVGILKVTSENSSILRGMLNTLRGTLDELEEAIKGFDPKAIRDVLGRMTGFADVLPDEAGAVLDDAIEKARKRASSISRTEKKIGRMDRALEELVGDEDPMEELKRYVDTKKRVSRQVKERAVRIAKLVKSKEEAVKRMEKLKETVDSTPVRLARFAVMRPQDVENLPSEDKSAELYAATVSSRFARMGASS